MRVTVAPTVCMIVSNYQTESLMASLTVGPTLNLTVGMTGVLTVGHTVALMVRDWVGTLSLTEGLWV